MITAGFPNMREILRRLPNERDAKKAASRAINRSLVAGRKAAGEEVAKDYKISGGKVNKLGKLEKSNVGSLKASIKWSGPAIPLEEWGTNPKNPPKRRRKKPILGTVFRGTKTTYRGAFIGRVYGGQSRAYVRTTKKRFPIRRVYGPSAASLVGARLVQERFTRRASEILERRLEHEINYILSRG